MSSIRRELFAGEVLFQQGEASNCAWLIEQGSIELASQLGRRSLSQGVLGPGELIGELSLLDDAPRSTTATAVTDTVLLSIDSEQFAERLDGTDPIIRALLTGLRRRTRAILSALPADARLQLPGEEVPSEDRAERGGIEKIRLETQLREALEKNGLEVRYQPIFDLKCGRVGGYEALVRWQHPERGAVSPAEFIKLAEETSLIVPVGEYVLDQVCALLAELKQGADELPTIAVNLSARQLVEPGMARQIIARIENSRLPPGALKLEVTESRMLDYEPVAAVMRHCRAQGVPFALDDFGTGYSNLTHLYKLDFEVVKVDQAFARHMFDSPKAMAVVEAVVGMAHGIGADVVMEGVETAQQLQRLSELRVRYAQGYLIGQAQPRAAVVSGEAAAFRP